MLKYIAEETFAVVSKTHEVVNDVKTHFSTQQRDQILQWLCSHDYSKQFEDNRERCLLGTGQWFLKHETFLDWLKTSGSCTLFCPGDPGTGKTMMSTLIIEHLITEKVLNPAPVIYVFCDYKRENEQTLAHFTASLLRQLASQSVQVYHAIEQLHSRCTEKQMLPSLQDLQTHLEGAFRSVTTVSIVIDALDECGAITRQKLIPMIHGLSHYNIHLLATSRVEPTVQALFTNRLFLEITASKEDVRSYVSSRVTDFALANQYDPDLASDVVRGVTDAAEGV
jgi:Cdc6-like AAA superfamily ATPase